MIHEHLAGTPTLSILRIAGQYGKPRSKPTEVVEGLGEIMSFKGENINGYDPKDRKLDPERLLLGYWHSAATLNYLRGYAAAADASDLAAVNIAALSGASDLAALTTNTQEISAKYASSPVPTQFFTAHEAMQLDLEES